MEDLLALGQENEDLKRSLSNEKQSHEAELRRFHETLEDQVRGKEDRIIALETKESLINGILAMYQEKLKTMSDTLQSMSRLDSIQKNRLALLEYENEQYRIVIDNQQHTINSHTASQSLI